MALRMLGLFFSARGLGGGKWVGTGLSIAMVPGRFTRLSTKTFGLSLVPSTHARVTARFHFCA